jgi:DNA-binding CsgD family transcriptional regulator
MSSADDQRVAVVIEEAPANEVAPMIMAAFGLTERERTIAAFVCQGRSTRQIADTLHLTTDTVQDHLKSVFDRTGVRSRGALVATILQRQINDSPPP